MSHLEPHQRENRVSEAFLRALGAMSISMLPLEQIRATTHCFPAEGNVTGWCEFADHLIDLAGRVREAAAEATGAAQSVRVRIDRNRAIEAGVDYVEKLTAKVQMHTRTAHLLGYDRSLVVGADLVAG